VENGEWRMENGEQCGVSSEQDSGQETGGQGIVDRGQNSGQTKVLLLALKVKLPGTCR
jgi:hypothetical protein